MPNIIMPNENDVKLGRGGRSHEHEGNEQLRSIVRSRVGDYQRATKKQKAVISRQILQQIQSMDPEGRFILKNYNTYEWEVVADAVAREKVCQSLRDATAMETETTFASSQGGSEDVLYNNGSQMEDSCDHPSVTSWQEGEEGNVFDYENTCDDSKDNMEEDNDTSPPTFVTQSQSEVQPTQRRKTDSNTGMLMYRDKTNVKHDDANDDEASSASSSKCDSSDSGGDSSSNTESDDEEENGRIDGCFICYGGGGESRCSCE